MSTCRFSTLWGGSLTFGALLALMSIGCGGSSSTLPTTYPVAGTVHYKGGSPVAGGAIEFSSISDTSFSISGEIDDTGSFTLYTIKGSDRVRGVPEGEYKVTVRPPIQSDHRPVPAIALLITYRVEPKDNTFTIEVETTRKKT
jgi:hypothetical protein